MRLHFISGLPRSGSTLLAAILRQNPRFTAGMSSPVAQLVMQMQRCVSRGQEGAASITDEQRQRILRGVFKTYYGPIRNGQVVFDTNRSWCAKLPLLASLYPGSKVICMVRDVGWIMNSIEKRVRSNPLGLSGVFNFNPGGTVFDRIAGLAGPEGLVGYAMNALREAYNSEFADRLLLIDYEALVRKPEQALRHVYNFVSEEWYKHNFDDVSYEAEDFDLALGMPGLHTVKGPVQWRERDMILPVDLFSCFRDDAFWKNQNTNYRKVSTVLFAADKPRPVAYDKSLTGTLLG